MKSINKSIRFIGVVSIVLILSGLSGMAQSFPSKWIFANSSLEKITQTWEKNGYVVATVTGEGIMAAVDKEGKPLSGCKVMNGRPAIASTKPGDCFMFTVPVESLSAGSYIGFDATLTADPGAPKHWVVEWSDGLQWKTGREYVCHGPAFGKEHTYTCIHQVFRLENDVEKSSLKVRLRALEGELIPARNDMQSTGASMLVSSTYLGAYVQNLGTSHPEDTTRILCLGNSFTYYHSSPGMLKEIAWNEGHFLDLSVSVKGGRCMKHHQTLEMTQDNISEGGFDLVILQDQSRAAGWVGQDRKKNAHHIDEMVVMADMIRSTSPDCAFVVERTWAYPGKGHGSFGSIKAFDTYSKKGVRIMARAVGNAEVANIAEAFKYCREEHPDIMLYHTDSYHPSVYGSYLKSCVNYLVLFGEPFGETPADCGLEPEKAAVLRSIAEKVILK